MNFNFTFDTILIGGVEPFQIQWNTVVYIGRNGQSGPLRVKFVLLAENTKVETPKTDNLSYLHYFWTSY